MEMIATKSSFTPSLKPRQTFVIYSSSSGAIANHLYTLSHLIITKPRGNVAKAVTMHNDFMTS
jgi:hypothetical protein